MQDENTMPRREFLKRTLGAGAAAAAATMLPFSASAEPQDSKKDDKKPPLDKNDKSTMAAVFDGITLTDQHGKELKPAELFREGPSIVLFGYGGCPRCQEISHTVSAIQQKLIDKDKKVPIIVVSVQPKKDKETMREYIARYHELGIRQFQPADDKKKLPDDAKERRKQAEQAFDAYDKKGDDDKGKEQADRIFHIVCPPEDDNSKTIQDRISEALKLAGSKKLLITSKNPKEHTAFVTIFNDGKAVETYRALNPSQEAPESFAKSRADEVVSKIEELSQAKAPKGR